MEMKLRGGDYFYGVTRSSSVKHIYFYFSIDYLSEPMLFDLRLLSQLPVS